VTCSITIKLPRKTPFIAFNLPSDVPYRPMAVYTLAPFIGPVAGPLISGYVRLTT
jgi:hypothetical protein